MSLIADPLETEQHKKSPRELHQQGIVEEDRVEQPPCTRRRWRNEDPLDAGKQMPKHRSSRTLVQLDFVAAVSSVPTIAAGIEGQVLSLANDLSYTGFWWRRSSEFASVRVPDQLHMKRCTSS